MGLAQNHVIHDNATSVTILPSSIAASRSSNFSNNLSFGNNALGIVGVSNNNQNNVALGHSALRIAYDGTANVAVGNEAGAASVYSDRNVTIGHRAMRGTGPSSGSGNNNDDNIAIGVETLSNLNYGNIRNIAIGNYAMRGYSSSNNIAIGYSAGNGGLENVFLGHQSGYLNVGSGNLFLGHSAGYNETGNGKLYIENSNSNTPLIGGDFANDIVGINTPIANLATNPTWKLQVGGDINSTGTVRAAGVALTSDVRFKKNIMPLQNSLADILKINGVSYDWRKDEFADRNFTNKKQIGLIAQEIEKIYPEMVETDVNGYKSINYLQFTPVLIEALKELTHKVQYLESENKKLLLLTKRIENLENTTNVVAKIEKE